MTDPIALLARAADRAAADADLAPDPVDAVRARVARRRRGRWARVAAVAAVVALAAGTAVALTRGDDDPEGVATTPTTTEPVPAADAPPSPLSPRRQVALAPAGDEVVVWGGFTGTVTVVSDGAAYDRASGEWRTLPPSPLDDRDAEGMAPVAAADGPTVVVVRGRAAAAWDATTDGWTELDDAPDIVTDLTAVGDGRFASFSAGAVLDLTTGAWEQPRPPHAPGLPDLPGPVGPPYELEGDTTSVWTGEVLLTFGHGVGSGPDQTSVLGFDPVAVEWVDIPTGISSALAPTGLAASWDGSRVVVVNAEMQAVAYDPVTADWSPLTRAPARFFESYPATASVGGVTVAGTAQVLAVFDGETWTPYPAPDPDVGGPPGRWLVPVDDATVATWVDDAGPGDADLVLIEPTALAAARRLQVGVVAVQLGPDDVVEATTSDGARNLVVLSVDPAGRGPCQVTNGFPAPAGTPEQRAVEEEVTVLSGPKTWFRSTDGTHWETEVGDQDLVTVECRDPDAARRLVEAMDLTVRR